MLFITSVFDGRRPLAASKVGCQICWVVGLRVRLDRYFETFHDKEIHRHYFRLDNLNF